METLAIHLIKQKSSKKSKGKTQITHLMTERKKKTEILRLFPCKHLLQLRII